MRRHGSGQALVEYVVLLAMGSLVAIGAVALAGPQLSAAYSQVSALLANPAAAIAPAATPTRVVPATLTPTPPLAPTPTPAPSVAATAAADASASAEAETHRHSDAATHGHSGH
jgi:Flp pilus assembly pilin Flp